MVVCPRITVTRAEPGNPYTLHDVRYTFRVEPDCEFPYVEPELWLFVRFMFEGRGKKDFIVRVVWLDAPGEEVDCGLFTLPLVAYRRGASVVSRAWRLNYVSFPGEGRYTFRLFNKITGPVLAQEYIEVRR
jgi:hypothetical protein